MTFSSLEAPPFPRFGEGGGFNLAVAGNARSVFLASDIYELGELTAANRFIVQQRLATDPIRRAISLGNTFRFTSDLRDGSVTLRSV